MRVPDQCLPCRRHPPPERDVSPERGRAARHPYLAQPEPTRRQDFETVYQRNGAVYLVTTEFFFRTGKLRGDNPMIYEMP